MAKIRIKNETPYMVVDYNGNVIIASRFKKKGKGHQWRVLSVYRMDGETMLEPGLPVDVVALISEAMLLYAEDTV